MVIVMFASYFLTKLSKKLNERAMKAKDVRMKATEEMLDIVRFIKITAIEKFFYRKVDEKREAEIKNEIKKTLNTVGIICMYWLISPLLMIAAFVAYTLLGNDISPEVAFTTMSVVRLF